MRLTIIFLILSTAGLSAQSLELSSIEKIIDSPNNGSYYSLLENRGYNLTDKEDNGDKGFYEKWEIADHANFLSVQHNEALGFTKIIISVSENIDNDNVMALIDDLKNSYKLETIDQQDYYINVDNPEITAHLIKLNNVDASVNGVLFFHKF